MLGKIMYGNFSTKIQEQFLAAAIQFNPVLYKWEENIHKLMNVLEEAFKNNVKLAVTPEMATTGYDYRSRKDIMSYVDTIPGGSTERFAELTQKYQAYAVVGMAEVDSQTGLFYNSAVLLGPQGYIGKYRKLHQWEREKHWAAWGDLSVPVFDTELGKIGINICMDSVYFESARLAALGGADILAFPTNSTAQSISTLAARAQQNGLYVISANRSNTENDFHMVGASAIWSPTGEKLTEAPYIPTSDYDMDEPTIIYAYIDPEKYSNINKQRLYERRPELYKDLMLYISPWDYSKNNVSHEVDALILQYEPVFCDKDANMKRIYDLAVETNEQYKNDVRRPKLLVLPELSLIGSLQGKTIKEILELAEEEKGGTLSYMTMLAKYMNCAVAYGIIEIDMGVLYNTAFLIDKEGNIVGKYRKVHLGSQDRKWAQAGSDIDSFYLEGVGKVGLMIGEDAAFPESAGILAIHRVDVIALLSAWNGQYGGYMEINREVSANPYPHNSMVLWDAVALGAQAYTLVSNFVGTEKGYKGSSALYTIDPHYGLDQPIAASKKDEQALLVNFTTLQRDWWFNQEKLISSRRTPYYVPLVVEDKFNSLQSEGDSNAKLSGTVVDIFEDSSAENVE